MQTTKSTKIIFKIFKILALNIIKNENEKITITITITITIHQRIKIIINHYDIFRCKSIFICNSYFLNMKMV